MPSITPFLWFDGQAEEAANHYVAIFPSSRVTGVTRYDPGSAGGEGSVMTVSFVLDGREFVGLNGGPQFTFSEAISFQIHCRDEAEVDHYWSRLTEGGQEGRCGWLKDRYGVSWQVVPSGLPELLGAADPKRAERALQAMMTMSKIDVAEMARAADAAPA